MSRFFAPAAHRSTTTGAVAIITLLTVLVCLAVVPTIAAAATWYEPTPAPGAVVQNGQIVIAYAYDPVDPIVSGSLNINGFECTPVGFSTDPIYLFSTMTYDPTAPGAFPSPLPDGPNNAVATVVTQSGATDTYAWTFTVNAEPTIVSVVPAEGSLVTNSNAPTITVTLSDPDDATFSANGGYIMRVDGSNVTPTWNAGAKSYSYKRTFPPNPPWPNGSAHTVQFNVQDSAGNVVYKQWSFTVDTSADTVAPTLSDPKPIPGSVTTPRPTFSITAADNRPGNLTVRFSVDGSLVNQQTAPQGVVSWTPTTNMSVGTHNVSVVAVDAANNTSAAYTWSFTVEDAMTLYHTTKTTPFTACAKCHNQLITTEHTNRGFTCDTCHASTDTTISNAIANNDTRCEACHASAQHTALHEGGFSNVDCANGCHVSNISAEHDDDCAKCHTSTDPKVIAAIANGKSSCSSCHQIHPPGFWRFRKDYYSWTMTPDWRGEGPTLGSLGANPQNPGAHANYLANTAKCGMCHSVHRAAAGAGQVKLLAASDASCAGCHTGSTAVTAKVITWTPYSTNWVPEVDPASPLAPLGSPAWLSASGSDRVAAITNKTAAGGAANQGGPHNDSALDLIADGYWDGTGATPQPSYELGHRYGCATRRCHLDNPHGAGGSKYKLFAAKLLFNAPANDDLEGVGTYGGLDAAYDALGATDASVERFIAANPSVIQATADGNLLIKKAGDAAFRAPDANETHSLVSGLTCGRPSNPSTGEDECHAEATYAIVDKAVRELRNKPTEITAGSAYRTDNTGTEAAGYGGNDSRSWKTGHVAGTFDANTTGGSYAPIAGCTGCHDQIDRQNTTAGNFTFPHGQTVTSATATNLLPNASATPNRARLWMGYASNVGAPLQSVGSTSEKAFDGTCLKCHRDVTNTQGIGLTK